MAVIAAGLAAGADDYVGRPFHQPELMARLRAVLRLRQVMVRHETAQAVVAALANAVEAKDGTTQHHCQRLAQRALLRGPGRHDERGRTGRDRLRRAAP